jgi:hypothetical protein
MAKILGIIWLILGILWLARPEALKNRLKRKMSRRIRLTIYGFLIVFGILIVGTAIKAQGLLPKIAGIVGALLVIKGIFLVLSKASEKLWAWWAEQPILIFRLQALFIIAVGIILILV